MTLSQRPAPDAGELINAGLMAFPIFELCATPAVLLVKRPMLDSTYFLSLVTSRMDMCRCFRCWP